MGSRSIKGKDPEIYHTQAIHTGVTYEEGEGSSGVIERSQLEGLSSSQVEAQQTNGQFPAYPTQYPSPQYASGQYSMGSLTDALPQDSFSSERQTKQIDDAGRWSMPEWDAQKGKWYRARLDSKGSWEYDYSDNKDGSAWPSKDLAQTTTSAESLQGLEESRNYKVQASASTWKTWDGKYLPPNYNRTPQSTKSYCYEEPRLGFRWISAEGISAAVLAHRIQSGNDGGCRTLACEGKESHINLGKRVNFVLFVHHAQRGFILDYDVYRYMPLLPKELESLRRHSKRYAEKHGTRTENVMEAEFGTAEWIGGRIPSIAFRREDRNNNENGKAYAGGAICPQCSYWTPYGNHCITRRCNGKSLAPGTLVEATEENQGQVVSAEFFHPPDGEDVGIGIVCMAIGGLVVAFYFGRSVRGS